MRTTALRDVYDVAYLLLDVVGVDQRHETVREGDGVGDERCQFTVRRSVYQRVQQSCGLAAPLDTKTQQVPLLPGVAVQQHLQLTAVSYVYNLDIVFFPLRLAKLKIGFTLAKTSTRGNDHQRDV